MFCVRWLNGSLVVASLALLCSPAAADWVKVTNKYKGATPPPQTDACWNSSAVAWAWSVGTSAGGGGSATDDTPFCDVRVQNNATGWYLESWVFMPESDGSQGWAKVWGEVHADASVTLVTSNTGAVAVGYALAKSNLFDQVTAELNESAAETSSSILGEISLEIEGFGASIPVKAS